MHFGGKAMTIPTFSGIGIDQAVTGTSNINPFSTMTIADADGDTLTVTVAVDQSGSGAFTADSLAESGFTVNAFGNLTRTGTAEEITTGIRKLVFNPADPVTENGGRIGFTLSADDDGGGPPEVILSEAQAHNSAPSAVWTEGAVSGPPAITSNGGGNTTSVQVLENTKAVTNVNATDPDGDTLAFSLFGGADEDKFTINASTGILKFIAAPDFEKPADANDDNIYQVVVKVTAGGQTDKQTINVVVQDVLGKTINGDGSANVVDLSHTVEGEPGPSPESDTIHGKGGGDRLSGLGGSDIIFGGAGDDVLKGGSGLDLLDGDDLSKPSYSDSDTADYSDKTTSIVVRLDGEESVKVRIENAAGNLVTEDIIKRIENLTGGSGDDTFTGDNADNTFKGNDGDDTFVSSTGTDVYDGGAGKDLVSYKLFNAPLIIKLAESHVVGARFRVGDDLIVKDLIKNVEDLVGGRKGDILGGDAADNTLRGGEGNDTLSGFGGVDELNGGAGSDTADYSAETRNATFILTGQIGVVEFGGEGEDVLLELENIIGGSGDDGFSGDTRSNHFEGRGGSDVFNGNDDVAESGRDLFDGGTGPDLVSYDSATRGIEVHLDGKLAATVFVAGVAKDKVINIEAITGGKAGDELEGDEHKNVLIGGGGADKLDGGLGVDVLTGGGGSDKDQFFFTTTPDSEKNFDVVSDFQHGIDEIMLSKSVFTNAIGESIKGLHANDLGPLLGAFFHIGLQAGPGATGKNDFILYDQANGILSYDPDGNREAHAEIIAVFKRGTVMTSDDFTVIA
ncbi:hypothetical protein BH10PSE7_BH10PSE7_07800 [soil metagenome]